MSNGWSDWHQIWYPCADSSGNGYTPNNCPERHKEHWGGGGGLGGQTFKSQGSCQTAGPIGFNFGSRLRIHLGMGIGKIQVTPQYPRGHVGGGGGGVRGSHIKKSGEAVKRLNRLAPNLVHIW